MIAEKIESALSALEPYVRAMKDKDYLIVRAAFNELHDAARQARHLEVVAVIPTAAKPLIEYGPKFD
jgi:hypothetical protein